MGGDRGRSRMVLSIHAGIVSYHCEYSLVMMSFRHSSSLADTCAKTGLQKMSLTRELCRKTGLYFICQSPLFCLGVLVQYIAIIYTCSFGRKVLNHFSLLPSLIFTCVLAVSLACRYPVGTEGVRLHRSAGVYR